MIPSISRAPVGDLRIDEPGHGSEGPQRGPDTDGGRR